MRNFIFKTTKVGIGRRRNIFDVTNGIFYYFVLIPSNVMNESDR